MSCFMCCPETIYNISTYIYWYREHYAGENSEYPYDIYLKLIEMNRDAVKARYPGRYEDMLGDDEDYKNYPKDIPSYYGVKPGLGLLTMIDCLMYQCDEGDIPETNELYKELEKIRIYLTLDIIANLEHAIGFDKRLFWK